MHAQTVPGSLQDALIAAVSPPRLRLFAETANTVDLRLFFRKD